ncbi:MAG: DNA/RNA nuclease SfsA [Syntrophomonas sp.]|nr:DNA/RNA nuclease SfsA [Syntrophomonas sp.]
MVFIIQMQDVLYFTPNKATHQAFGEALIKAEKHGVKILALDCEVAADFYDLPGRRNIRVVQAGGVCNFYYFIDASTYLAYFFTIKEIAQYARRIAMTTLMIFPCFTIIF